MSAIPSTPLPPAPVRWRWLGLAALLAAEAMNLLDSTIVQVAAPVIHAELGGRVSDIQWFSAAYTLVFALLLITGGRLGDIWGRRRVFRVGVTGFGLASLACALAPSAGVLIAARVVQGAASAVVIPQTFGLILAMFEGRERARALGSIGPVMGLAAVSGPVLGGVLTHADLFGASWRAVFAVNLPLAAAVLVLAPLLVEDRAPRRAGLDPVGTALAALGTGLVVYPLIDTGTVASRPEWTWGSVAAGVAVLVGFGLHQRGRARRGRGPLIEVGLFAHAGFAWALATSTLFFAVTTGLMLVVVLHLQLGLGAGPLVAGLGLLPWSAGMAVASWVAGARLMPRYGTRLMFPGLAVLLAGVVAAVPAYQAAAGPGAFPWLGLAALGVAGVGIGLFSVPFFSAALARAGAQEAGSAAGLLNAVQQVGGTLGVAVLGGVFLHSGGGPGAAVQAAFWVAAGLLVATAAAAVSIERPVGRFRWFRR
ncbi:MFS transporter [Pseudonocardia acaciae]|uniref:MFS transporter n=1 Tax=Pseudonocardia acaciae TaxID=551276 RepID=UPI000688781B|nr:MFS transporter [Pseudonocardia acaciae]